MPDVNPYQFNTGDDDEAAAIGKRRWGRIGFVLGAAAPVGVGIYQFVQFQLYLATLEPLGPNVVTCGTPAAAALFLILFGGPIAGFCGAAVGGTAGAIMNWLSPR